jgi:hypothetical protein
MRWSTVFWPGGRLESLERLGHEIVPLSYDVTDCAKLGLLHKLLRAQDPDSPAPANVAQIQKEFIDAIEDAHVISAIDSDPREHSRRGKPGSPLAH